MKDIIAKTIKKLEENGDEKTRESSKRFFKEEIKCHGLKSAQVLKIAKELFAEVKDRPKKEIFALCEEFWKLGGIEESGIACHLSYAVRKQYEPADFKIFERWVEKYVVNWAACDTLCNHTVGDFVTEYPEFVGELKKWTAAKNRWKKRAAAVSLIVPARKGMFLDDVFEIADSLLTDDDDMVRKGYGWMLKSASRAHEKEVFEYVVKNKGKMPRTALHYAIEKMPKDLKAKAMAK